ncbi:MAG TPA: molybdopterin-dependent oxidoreductase [Nocardioidaceae bacterium]|nr:molybdopterin-dependent oxidoreductase [Nocardioidaceae bacterium]
MNEPALRGLVAGVVSVGAGLGAAEVVTGLLSLRSSPVLAIGEGVIEVTPGDLAEAAIAAVGQLDKPLLVIGTVLGALLLGGLAGSLATSRRVLGMLVLVAMGGLGMVAAMSAPDSSVADALPPVVAALVSMGLLSYLLGWAARGTASESGAPSEPDERPGALDRRGFLARAGVVGLGAVALTGVGRLLSGGRQAVEAARQAVSLRLPKPVAPQGVAVPVPGVGPWITPNDTFYRIDTALAVPRLVPEDWRLRIHGMVDREIELTYDDLVGRGLRQHWFTLCCVSNEVGGSLIGNAQWSGVRIADLLAEAGVQPGADAVLSTSVDGWNCGTPLEALTDDRAALLAVAMNGEPLPIEHGFPVRMVVPGLYGYVSATKWVVDLEVSRFADFSAYWTQRGWSPRGPVKTQSRIDAPRNGDELRAGPVAVGGVAWAQHTGIEKVEVRIDDGPWQPARLAGVPNLDTWRQWAYGWDAEPGEHRVAVRATDMSGYTQTPERTDVVPDGATGWHTIVVSVT